MKTCKSCIYNMMSKAPLAGAYYCDIIKCAAPLVFEDVVSCSEHKPYRKRYWLWKIKGSGKCWEKTTTYVDEQGRDTTGQQVFLYWNVNGDNIKCEDDFVEV